MTVSHSVSDTFAKLDQLTNCQLTIDNTIDKTIDKPFEQTIGKTIDQTIDKTIDKNIDKTTGKTIEKIINKTINKTIDKTIEIRVIKSHYRILTQILESIATNRYRIYRSSILLKW